MNPTFQLVDSGWDKVIHDAAKSDRTELRVVCPFIKVRAAKRLLAGKRPETIQVITRFHPGDMCDGVSDTEALRLLLENGAKIRGVRNLHAKLYIFGDQRAIVTSANLTEAALLRNHEFGFVSSEPGIIARCREYFDQLWEKAGSDLDRVRLEEWERRIEAVQAAGCGYAASVNLGDEGADAGITTVPVTVSEPRVADAPQSFVKFFGHSGDRAPRELPNLAAVDRSACHWACNYPTSKRPRSVEDGAVMFMARLTEKPNDITVFGRAIAMRHKKGRDEASEEELLRRPWKSKWRMYVRVHHPEFVAGTLANGISLNELMDTLGADSFVSTQRNARTGTGNTNPRYAFLQQPAVQLTKEAFAWLNEQLELAFLTHGKLPDADLAGLDWPSPPNLQV